VDELAIRLQQDASLRGRGAWWNTENRFEERSWAYEDGDVPSGREKVSTELIEDYAKSIISRNDSPDVGFDFSINPYRGCEHGCAYCYARPTHEYMGYSAGLDFETKIFYKSNAGELLQSQLAKKSWRPSVIALSGATDPYQPVERKLSLTRSCLGVLSTFRNPAVVITKNRLVLRDIDVLAEMAARRGVGVLVSLTTLDLRLNRILEPRSSTPGQRLDVVAALRQAGVPVGVLVAPVIPGLTDHELPQLMSAAHEHGARFAGYVMLRLPHAVAPLFSAWLDEHYPDRKEKVLNRLRAMRGGSLYQSAFGARMRGSGLHADQTARLFEIMHKKLGFKSGKMELRTDLFRRPGGEQLELFR
jgi:DNA repair photolyase